MIDLEAICSRWLAVAGHLDERGRRLFAAAEVCVAGYGSDYRAEGCPDEVKVHDFVDKEFGKAIPYGVYDIGANTGWINAGIGHDTAEFAVSHNPPLERKNGT